MTTRRPAGRWTASIVALALAAGFPAGLVGLAQDPPRVNQGAPASPFAVLRGQVKTKGGAPLPGVRVRAAIPATDMRFVHPGSGQVLLETTSGADGEYRLEFPGIAQKTAVSLDALMPGFRRLVGTLMAGGDARRVEVGPGLVAEANLALEPALYFRGVVVDEAGRPIPSAQVASNLVMAKGTGSIEHTATAADGSFEIFGYDPNPAKFGGTPSRGIVHFSHPDYVESRSQDVYTIEPEGRGNLRVVLATGRRIAGVVLDAEGKPVPRAMVEVEPIRKATLTDADGRFALRGLVAGPTTLKARSLEIKQKAGLPMTIDADRDDLEVRLEPIVLPADIPRFSVLGMELADVTPGLKSAFDLFQDRGALILDPGPDPDRLKIGAIAEGNMFFMVGKTRIAGVRGFVDQILAETANGVAEEYSVRVVYAFKRPEMRGSNTQYLKLTRADLDGLRALSDRLKPKVP